MDPYRRSRSASSGKPLGREDKVPLPQECNITRQWIVAHMTRAPSLSTQQRQSLERHLRTCSNCRAVYADNRLARLLLRSSYETSTERQRPGLPVQRVVPATPLGDSIADLRRRMSRVDAYELRRRRHRKIRSIYWICVLGAMVIGLAAFLCLRWSH